MFKAKQKAFTLIELLVVIAIIGILATLAVVALQQARQNARDAKRMADMKQLQTAMELFFNENGRYPTSEEWNSGSIVSSTSQETFMYSIPSAPSPADGDCLEASNTYTYIPQNNGASYTIDFCTGKQVSDLPEGAKQMTPGGIIFGSSGSGEEEPTDPFAGTSGTFIDTRDSQEYAWVKIGNQIWMAENLKYLPVVHNNTDFANQGVNLLPGYGVYGYNGSDVNTAKAQSNYSIYGVLYNWYAVNQTSVCPDGWHVPTHYELIDLERSTCSFLGNIDCDINFPMDSTTLEWLGTNEGSALAGNYALWADNVLRNNVSFSSANFNLYPSGLRDESGDFYFLGQYTCLYSSTGGLNAFVRQFWYNNSTIGRTSQTLSWGFSIRCLKD